MANNTRYPGQRNYTRNEQQATAQPRLEGLPPVARPIPKPRNRASEAQPAAQDHAKPATSGRREPNGLVVAGAMGLNFFEGLFGTKEAKQIPGYARFILFLVGLGTGTMSAIITQSYIQFKNPQWVWLGWIVVIIISASEIAAAYIGHGNYSVRLIITGLRLIDIGLNVMALHHANYSAFNINNGDTWLYIFLGTALAILPEPMVTQAARGWVA